jgi:hypothetical protein
MASLSAPSPEVSPPGVMGFLHRRRNRFIIYAVLAVIFGVLSFFPRFYISRVKLISQDPAAGGLSSALGMLGGVQNFASLLGSHQTAEVYLMVGRGNEVVNEVIKKMHLIEDHRYATVPKAIVGLSHKVDIHSLNGGVLEIEVHDRDPKYALALVQAYRTAIEDRVKTISREQAALKRRLVAERFADSTQRLAETQQKLEAFRRANNLAEPGEQFGSQLGMRASLEGQLRAKQVQLQTARQFSTDQSIEVQTIRSDIAGLEGQIGRLEAETNQAAGLQSLATKSIEYLNLYREVQFAQALHEIYTRSLEQVTVSELLADSSQDLASLEEPFVEAPWRPNIFGLAPLALILLLAFYIEYYVPATRLGYRRPRRD